MKELGWVEVKSQIVRCYKEGVREWGPARGYVYILGYTGAGEGVRAIPGKGLRQGE